METAVIIGSGIIGKSWALLFASKGHSVRLYDSLPSALEAAPGQIAEQIRDLDSKGQLLGSEEFSAEEQIKLITVFPNLKDALDGATYVQENTPETVEMKTEIFKNLNDLVREIGNEKVILCSSTSTIKCSEFTSELEIKNRTLVVHPVNPPYFVPMVELVPSEWTNPAVTSHVRELMKSLGRKPIVMNKELPGFALNRIQYVILCEYWRLINDGILSVEDADTVMRDGLAPRYIFMGPMETAHLNAHGFIDYCKRYHKVIYDVMNTMGPIPLMSPEAAENINTQLQELVPDETLPERRNWRDNNLALFATFKKSIGLK